MWRSSSQRYLQLDANQAVNNYWIRALSNLTPVGTAGGIGSAILRYTGAPHAEPITVGVSTNPLNEQALKVSLSLTLLTVYAKS